MSHTSQTTSPNTWRWWCRIDGSGEEHSTPEARNQGAIQHRDHDCVAAKAPHAEWAEVGHLVHVWRW